MLTLIVLSAVSLAAALVQAGLAKWELKTRFGRAPKRRARTLRGGNVRAASRQILGNYSMGLLEIAYREMDVQLLAAMADATEAGRYKIAKNLAMILMELLGPVVMMSLPEFSARVATQRWNQVISFARRAAKLLATLAVATALPMFFLVPVLVKQFLPAQSESLPTFVILLGSFVLCAPLLWSQSLLVAMSSAHRYVVASAIGAVTSFVMAFALIPSLGARGSAIAFGTGLLTVSSIASFFALAIARKASLG